MPLADTAIRNAKPREKQYKLADEKGLYVLVTATGKYFRFDFRFAGKRKTLSLGVYPDVTLKFARDKRDEARHLLANGIDPSERKRSIREHKISQAKNSFEAVAREWLSKQTPVWAKNHSSKVILRLENDIFPWFRNRPVEEISSTELLTIFRRIEDRGAIDSAHRAKQTCSQIFRYAIATGRCDRDPAADLRGALQPVAKKHYPSITDPRQIRELLLAIDGYSGSHITKYALRLAPLVFVRPGELRHAEWVEIDVDRKEWRLPATKMKSKQMHIVPLSVQAIRIIEELRPLTGEGKYLFPSIRTITRPTSENTINAALRRLGYTQQEMTGHGFRAMASTSLHEQGWPSDVIERQLAHNEKNPVKAAYNHAEYLPERQKMMQAWADYLDNLKM